LCVWADIILRRYTRHFVRAATCKSSGLTQLDELGRLPRQWLSDLDAFKDSLRAQGAEPKVLEYVNEVFGRLVEHIKQLAG
jgi:hypothetical protein